MGCVPIAAPGFPSIKNRMPVARLLWILSYFYVELKTNRRQIALSLLVLWAGACGAPWLPWISWKLNQQALAERYCENRMRPELKCNGRCYLAKHLRVADEQPTAQAPRIPLEFGWIGGLLPLDEVECPHWALGCDATLLIPPDWPLPRNDSASPEPPPPRA